MNISQTPFSWLTTWFVYELYIDQRRANNKNSFFKKDWKMYAKTIRSLVQSLKISLIFCVTQILFRNLKTQLVFWLRSKVVFNQTYAISITFDQTDREKQCNFPKPNYFLTLKAIAFHIYIISIGC